MWDRSRISQYTGQAATPTYGGQTVATDADYAPHGALAELAYGETYEHRDHNALLQVSEIGLDTTQGLAGMLKLVYTYGASGLNNGNVQTQQIIAPGLNRTQYYDYDGVNRLEIASEGAAIVGSSCPGGATWCQNYGYDAYGNRWLAGAAFPTPSQQSHFETSPGQTINRITLGSVLYDSAGNLTRDGSGLVTMAYDAESRMTSLTHSGMASNNRTYGYDGEGRRALATTTSTGKRKVFVYDAFGRMAAEYDEAAPVSTGSISYLSTDHLGSTRAAIGASGSVTAYYDFKPFGERIGSGVGGRSALWGTDSGVKQLFTAKERDEESGLDYFGARYMASLIGRFTSSDPLDGWTGDPASWNKYAYARNNPLLYVDPNGMRYTICDTSGNCEQNYSDADFDKNLSGTSRNGTIYDNDGNEIGTYQRTSFDDLSPMGNMFFGGMSTRRDASNQMIATVAGGSAAVGVAGGVATSTGAGVVIDGVAYTMEQLAALGPEVLAKLVAAGKISMEVVQRLSVQAPIVANQIYLRLFAQSNNTTIAQGWLNNNNYLRIGENFMRGVGPVFGIAIGSKHAPLPSSIPGVVKGTFHINLWRGHWR